MYCNIDYWNNLLQLLSNISTILGGAAIIYAVLSYKVTQKQLNFAVLDRCISIFHERYLYISNDSDRVILKSYVDFVNEELFYFEKDYIHKDVAIEWIDGMINYMPIYNQVNKILNPNNSITKIDELNLFKDFQRVKKAFVVKNKYNFDLIYSETTTDASYLDRKNERERLAKEIYKNLK
jgi:hypothetical protein